MRHAFSFVIVSIAACILGVGSAWLFLSIELPLDKIQLGQWEIWPNAGEASSDPYTRAYLARQGTVWMSTTEGLVFFASHDNNGEPLVGYCTYSLSGKVPRGRLWTLTSEQRTSSFTQNESKANFATSNDVVWNEDGTLEVIISRKTQPGNWLPLTTQGVFVLVLRIYDTPLTSGALDTAIKTPWINKKGCS